MFRREGCIEAGCLAHARRKFDELAKANASPEGSSACRACALRSAARREQEETLRSLYYLPLSCFSQANADGQ